MVFSYPYFFLSIWFEERDRGKGIARATLAKHQLILDIFSTIFTTHILHCDYYTILYSIYFSLIHSFIVFLEDPSYKKIIMNLCSEIIMLQLGSFLYNLLHITLEY